MTPFKDRATPALLVDPPSAPHRTCAAGSPHGPAIGDFVLLLVPTTIAGVLSAANKFRPYPWLLEAVLF